VNALGYIAPLVVWVLYLVLAQRAATLLNAFIWVAIFIMVTCVHVVLSPGFAIISALLSIFTYSSFVILFTVKGKDISGPRLWHKTLGLLRWIALLEGSWGIVQAVYGYMQTGSFAGSNGDYVEGTLHPALRPELSFSNPMFATNMTFLLLALAPSVILHRKYIFAFLVGALALILSSVLHVLYLLIGALAIAIILYFPSLLKYKAGLLLAVSGVVFAVVVFSVVGLRVDVMEVFLRLSIEGRTPRGVVTGYVLHDMPREYPFFPILGLGPGQFSSRAGLIASGLFFGTSQSPRSLPFLPTAMSPAFRKYVMDAWRNVPRLPGLTGSTTEPWFSWLSVYVEFGGAVFAFIAIWVGSFLLHLRRYSRTPALRVYTIALGTGILLLFLLGIQENYWEVPQAIFVGLLLLKLQYANLRARRDQSHGYGSLVA
jgi:hypothetical protein